MNSDSVKTKTSISPQDWPYEIPKEWEMEPPQKKMTRKERKALNKTIQQVFDGDLSVSHYHLRETNCSHIAAFSHCSFVVRMSLRGMGVSALVPLFLVTFSDISGMKASQFFFFSVDKSGQPSSGFAARCGKAAELNLYGLGFFWGTFTAISHLAAKTSRGFQGESSRRFRKDW